MDCFEALGELTADATVEQVKLRWRHLVKTLHPDTGGSAEQFVIMHKHYLEALRRAAIPKPCPACEGRKTKTVNGGWYRMSMPCPTCGGSGEKTEKPASHTE